MNLDRIDIEKPISVSVPLLRPFFSDGKANGELKIHVEYKKAFHLPKV
jgi:hypothetical protein